jgi:transposase
VQAKRAAWPTLVEGVPAEDLVFLDEFGSATNMTRRRGWSSSGTPCHSHAPHGHWKMLTTIAALTVHGITASLSFDGACDTEAFTLFAEQVLAPTLRPGQVVVMDNLQPHKAPAALAAIRAAGAEVLFLPPYSPDLNPIELAISKAKRKLRDSAARGFESLFTAIGRALDSVAPSDAANFIRHCGYRPHATSA